jgi:chemotaxis protein histidine kinase CheA
MNEPSCSRPPCARACWRRDQRATSRASETLNFIFAPGFSTTTSVTDTRGRGVGMDVVKTNISRLGGVIDVQSEHGIGSKFTITLPVTLAIISALLVRVRDRWYALPITSVQEAIALDEKSRAHRGGPRGAHAARRHAAHLPPRALCSTSRTSRARSTAAVRGGVALGHRRLGFVVDALASGSKTS